MGLFRDYEIQLWTLQDEFLTVLKPYGVENKYFINQPEMKLNIDGTQEFTGEIPMYIYRNTERVENPVWYNVEQGIIITDLSKIKIIFCKHEEDEKVFEFLITKLEERHTDDNLYCKITCEGLAFHELGKIGYKVSLTAEDFYEEDKKLFSENGISAHPTLQYWLDHFIKPWNDEEAVRHLNQWYYIVDMDWSSYSQLEGGDARAVDKVYEEPYTSSWELGDNIILSRDVKIAQEKERLVDLKESNYYNLTQDLAKSFDIFCRYEYEHDSNYYITARKIIFYNNFSKEKIEIEEGIESLYLNISYPYETSEITRETDSTDLITKMFVQETEYEYSDSNISTIANAEANKTKEDYLLNFDYLKVVKGITSDQEERIAVYEAKVRILNEQLIDLQKEIFAKEEQLPEKRAALTFHTNAALLDQERLSAADTLEAELTRRDGTDDGYITISQSNPKTATLLKEDQENYYYINISEQGINPSSLHIYKTRSYSENKLSDELSGYVLKYDEFNNLVKVENIYIPAPQQSEEPTGSESNEEGDTTPAKVSLSRIVYLTYEYSPKLYYQEVANIWATRLENDTDKKEELQTWIRIMELELEHDKIIEDTLLKQLEDERKNFQLLMGAALREGYWQPEDYKDYGDRYVDNIKSQTNKGKGQSGYTQFVWDDDLFDDEQPLFYEVGAQEEKVYYPCLNLKNMLGDIQEHLNELSLCFFSYEQPDYENYGKMRFFSVNSQCQIAHVKNIVSEDHGISTILLVNGAESLTDEEINFMKGPNAHAFLGKVTPILKGNEVEYKVDKWYPSKAAEGAEERYLDASNWLNNVSNYVRVYPRIRVNSLYLKNTSDELSVRLNNQNLVNFEDYYTLIKTTRKNEENTSNYFITIDPYSFLKNYNTEANIGSQDVDIRFTISNADTAIYLDALKVLKENAYPKVSYSVNFNAIDKDFIKHSYDYLACIANINDVDLKFKDVQGYIAELTLDLNQPENDNGEVKNYKAKFEDLFSTIVAQTESMKKNEHVMDVAANVFFNDTIAPDVVQNSLRNIDLNYEFNRGNLTINEEEGIWAKSDGGVVAIRGGGIFTATQQDANGNWVWNTGILPSGINADLITTGQLDTNLIRIFSGDNIRFQWYGDGLYAYKTLADDPVLMEALNDNTTLEKKFMTNGTLDDADMKQFVVHNGQGIFLVAQPGAKVLNEAKNDLRQINNEIKRVEISWDGLKLRNWNNDEVFFADPDTGNLNLKGAVEATEFKTYMTDGLEGFIKINNEEGIQVVNSDQTQSFVASYDGVQMTGRVVANSGQFGPWLINENESIIYDPEITDNKQLGDNNIIYFGKDGLSFSDVLKIETGSAVDEQKIEHYIMKQFYIGNPIDGETSDENTNYVMRIKNINVEDSTSYYPPSYMLEFGSNFSFGKNFILSRENGGTGSTTGAYYRYVVSANSAQWEDEITNYYNSISNPAPGDIIVFSSNQDITTSSNNLFEASGTIINLNVSNGKVDAVETENSTSLNWHNYAYNNKDRLYNFTLQHDNVTFSRWNINDWGYNRTKNGSTIYPSGWSRVGCGYTTTSKCATFILFKYNGESSYTSANGKIAITFSFRTCFENNRKDSYREPFNQINADLTALADQRIFMNIYEYNDTYTTNYSTWSGGDAEPLATGIYNMTGNEGARPYAVKEDDPKYYTVTAYLDMLPNKKLENNRNYVIIFYNPNLNSLVYIQQEKADSQYDPSINFNGSTPAGQHFTPRIYIYSDFQWKQFGV